MADLDDPFRLAEFRPPILGSVDDHVLRECVERAAKRAEAPIAMVSFVMKRIYLFRAAVGLPPELLVTRAASRNRSFCQFVVKAEAPFIVTDAESDARVPRHILDVYPIGAYAGVPIRVGGHVLGSLCVADAVPRRWRLDLVGEMRELAERVSQRLETLTALGVSADEMTIVPPSNLAARAVVLAHAVHRSLVEVGPMVRLAKGLMVGASPDGLRRASTVLTEASDVYDDMMNAMAELCVATKRVEQSVAKAAG